jgi:hypothetical protein
VWGEQVKQYPGARKHDITNCGHYLKVRGQFSFQSSKIDEDDWELLLADLI